MITDVKLKIRSASAEESPLLTALVIRSKSVWPYPPGYVYQCRYELEITADYIKKWNVNVGELESKIIGFYSFLKDEDVWWMDHFWIEPEFQNKSYGKQFFESALSTARSLGLTVVRGISDPHAVGFYLRMGARQIGKEESKIIPGMFLPILEYYLK